MKRNLLRLLFTFCVINAGIVRADSDAVKNCIANFVNSCLKDCATAKCVSSCTAQAHEVCRENIVNPQMVFSGPVTSTFTNECVPSGELACARPNPDGTITGAACSLISGRVADRQFWGGGVTIFVVCPAADNPATVSVIGSATSSCNDGSFSLTATNACSGRTGCYGLIAVSPPPTCASCGTCSNTVVGDPGWATCTGAACPSP